jgi:hypothetical protein
MKLSVTLILISVLSALALPLPAAVKQWEGTPTEINATHKGSLSGIPLAVPTETQIETSANTLKKARRTFQRSGTFVPFPPLLPRKKSKEEGAL